MCSAFPEYILHSARALPSLPGVAGRLLGLAQRVLVDPEQMIHIIEADPSLTARVLRAANSERYGMGRSIGTVRDAAMLMGRDALVRLAVGACTLGRERSAWPVDARSFWKHSFSVATLARLLSEPLNIDPDEAYVAGLLHDIGKLILLEHFGDLYVQVLLAAQYGTGPLHMLEWETLSTDHTVAGHALCLYWNLPHALTDAIAQHHDAVEPAPNSHADVVRSANNLVKILRIGQSGNRFVETASAPLPDRRTGSGRLHTLFAELPAHFRLAETALGWEADGPEAPPFGGVIHLDVYPRDEQETLALVLLSMGFTSVEAGRMAAPDAAESETSPAALITSAPAYSARPVAYLAARVPVLDYAAWRRHHVQPGESRTFDAQALRDWIGQSLAQLAPA